MTETSWIWRCLALGSVLACSATVIELSARYKLTAHATTFRSFWLWVLTAMVLGLAGPAAVTQLRRGAAGRERQAIAVGFWCFDVLVALVLWRWSAGLASVGPRSVAAASALVAIALVVVSAREALDRAKARRCRVEAELR